MQAEIRSTAASSFPNVERFRQLHADGELADPAEVGARIWAAAMATDWHNGAIIDIRKL
jgi:hypothetical protein